MDIYNYYLSLNNDEYNYKTLLANEAKIKIKTNKIFVKKLDFLPEEFFNFLKCFEKNPDYYIEINDYRDFKLQFYKNILLMKNHFKFELLYRIVWNKLTSIRISIIYYKSHTADIHENYLVMRNYDINCNIDLSYTMTLPEAFETFSKYI